MNTYTFTNRATGKTIKRVSKTEAHKLFNSGINIQIVPHKFNPTSLWYIGNWYNIKTTETNFNTLVRNFEIHNCNCNETGKYAAFYVEEST